MRKTKKALALLLSASMMVSMAACGSKEKDTQGNAGDPNVEGTKTPDAANEPAYPGLKKLSGEVKNDYENYIVPDETVTLNVYSQLANYSGELQGWFATILKNKFNVVINIIPDGEGVYDSLMQEGDLGDIVIWGSNGSKYKKAIEAGLLYDWEKGSLLQTYGPYINEHMQLALEANRGLTDAGKIYGFGHNVASDPSSYESFMYTWDIRWDLYDQLGRPAVKNLDDYFDLLVKMKEICPTDENGKETYAVSLWPDWDGNLVMYVKSMVTAYYGYDELGIGNYDSDTGTYYDCLADGSPYLEMLAFFNKLYQNNLLDPNSMTQKYDQMMEKMKAGGVFFSIFDYAGADAYNTDEHLAENKLMTALIPDDARPLVYGMNTAGGNRVWTIGSKTQYPDLCMAIINYLSTPEGRLTPDYGPRGLCWDYNENNKTYFTEFGLTCHNDKQNTMMPAEWGGGNFNDGGNQMNNTTWSENDVNPETGERYLCDLWLSMQVEPRNETERAWREWAGTSLRDDYAATKNFKVAPATTMSESDQSDDLKIVWNQVTKCIVQYSWKAIYAKDNAEFDQIVAEMKKMTADYGYDQCLEWSLNEASIRNELEKPLRK